MRNYADELNKIERNFKDRLAKVQKKGKPEGPMLRTLARAEKRRKEFEAKMERDYGKDWRNLPKETHFDKILKRSMSNRVEHEGRFVAHISHRKLEVPYESSIHKPIIWSELKKSLNALGRQQRKSSDWSFAAHEKSVSID